MNPIREFNESIFTKYNLIPNVHELSAPLLISSNPIYIEKVRAAKPRILFIGQETNSWVNYDSDKTLTLEDTEKTYQHFLEIECATGRPFWRFIRECLKIERNELSNYVLWSNVLLAGKKNNIGAPILSDKLKALSLEYLLFLYREFKPDLTLFVAGPNNPYKDIIIKFLNIINAHLNGEFPTSSNSLLTDLAAKIAWTYHPSFLYQSKQAGNIILSLEKDFLNPFK